MSTAASPQVSDTGLGPIILMGVSGCGKSSVGSRLADMIGCLFVEGDSLHPVANIEKMRRGIPLEDRDREPWLRTVGECLASTRSIVVSCSALKQSYRDSLRRAAGGRVIFIYLAGERELLAKRASKRVHEYMPVSLLDSQLAILEDPRGEDNVFCLDITEPPAAIAAAAAEILSRAGLPREKQNDGDTDVQT